jgi:hypothetical protein
VGVVAGCTALWVAGVAAGARSVWTYQTTPGEAADSPGRWPSTSVLPAPAGRPMLLLIAHPHCPCTRATVAELSRLMARLGDRVATHVLVYRPREFAPGWERTDVWSAAERIPGVSVHVDVDGAEAARFGAATSGQVLLYDAGGRRRFSGGITNARGHVGESPAQEQIAAVVEGRAADEAAARVFGCALAGPATADPGDERGGT